MIRGISKLPPGSALTWSVADGTSELRRYWAPALSEGRGVADARGFDALCSELLAVLLESVRKELISDVPVGVFLSGGIDSSAVAAMMTRLGSEVKSFFFLFAHRPLGSTLFPYTTLFR